VFAAEHQPLAGWNATETTVIDRIDRRILGVLAEHGRMSWQALAAEVGLSPSAVTERVRRLERTGAIVGYRAVVSPTAAGRPLEAWVAVVLQPGADRDRFVTALGGVEAVVDAVHLTGAADYELRVRCRDTGELDDLLGRLKADHGVARTETRIVLRRVLGIDEVRLA
jgi:Lrp/AsnC family transcriptional regulator, leucine-responsive regulatory protein